MLYAAYWDELRVRAASGPLTATEIGRIMGYNGPDGVTRLRAAKHVIKRVEVVGSVWPRKSHMGPPAKLYVVTFRSAENSEEDAAMAQVRSFARSTKSQQREFRVVWQIAKGHAQQTRLYQKQGPAEKFFRGLPESYKVKRMETRPVGEWHFWEGDVKK